MIAPQPFCAVSFATSKPVLRLHAKRNGMAPGRVQHVANGLSRRDGGRVTDSLPESFIATYVRSYARTGGSIVSTAPVAAITAGGTSPNRNVVSAMVSC